MALEKRNRLEAALVGALLALAALAAFGMSGSTAIRPTPGSASRRALRPRLTDLTQGRAAAARPQEEDVDPPEVQVGERLFLETRFAQYFAANMTGINAPLTQGDPVLATLRTSTGSFAGPFAGQSMNCRNCHLVDDTAGAQTRTYADYSRKSLIPLREDGLTETPRNSPSLVNANLERSVPLLLHFDGEFPSLDDLVRGTLTGRNFGWLPNEQQAAVAHIARVIREDDGSDALAQGYAGLSFRRLLGGTDPAIPQELVLSPAYRLEVASASDAEILDGATRLISAYTRSLSFGNTSPYDVFLAKNGLPAAPDAGEADLDYSRRLRDAVNALAAPVFVTGDDGEFGEHDQEFVFGPDELKGLKIFLREPLPETLAGDPRYLSTRTGNCISCHAAPNFSDFSFHNTGATEEEFDAANGDGAFARLFIPDLAYRSAHHDAFLPATPQHPGASGLFRTAPADLGLWNVFANPDFPAPQAALAAMTNPDGLPASDALRRTIGLFKTPGLRDLGQSGPYLHTGRKRELEEVLEFYVSTSNRQRQGRLRNGSEEIGGIFLSDGDIDPLAAFLRSLNEDYN